MKTVQKATEEKKPKRIKEVFSHAAEVIHLWANQSQKSAKTNLRSFEGRSFRQCFFEGKSVYSYGRHYELGRLVSFRGMTVALINDTGYSVTTNGHIGDAYRATSHIPRIKTQEDSSLWSGSNLKGVIQRGLLRKQGELVEMYMKHFNGRSFSEYSLWDYSSESSYGEENQLKEFNSLCHKLGFSELILDIDQDFKDLWNSHCVLSMAREKELEAKSNSPEVLAQKAARQAAAEAKKLKDLEGEIKEWKNGGRLTAGIQGLPTELLRVVENEVQTSRHATVPLLEAMTLFRAIHSGKLKAGINYEKKIGSYTFNGLVHMGEEKPRIRIGCHSIKMEEAEAVLLPYMDYFFNPKLKLVSNERES